MSEVSTVNLTCESARAGYSFYKMDGGNIIRVTELVDLERETQPILKILNHY